MFLPPPKLNTCLFLYSQYCSYCFLNVVSFEKDVLSFLLISLQNNKYFQNSFKSFFDLHDVEFSYVACVYLLAYKRYSSHRCCRNLKHHLSLSRFA